MAVLRKPTPKKRPTLPVIIMAALLALLCLGGLGSLVRSIGRAADQRQEELLDLGSCMADKVRDNPTMPNKDAWEECYKEKYDDG